MFFHQEYYENKTEKSVLSATKMLKFKANSETAGNKINAKYVENSERLDKIGRMAESDKMGKIRQIGKIRQYCRQNRHNYYNATIQRSTM